MPQEKIKKIHLIYGCIAAVLIIALGIALILSCLDIYNSGARPYSPESIGLRFQNIALLAYVCIAIAVGGIILGLALPLDQKKPKPVKDELVLLEKAKAKAGACPAEAVAEQKKRLVFRIGTAAAFAVLMVYPAIYFMNPAHFTIASLNEDIAKAVTIALVPAAIGLLLCFVCSLLESKSIAKETEIYKKAAAQNKGQAPNTPVAADNKDSKKTLTAVRCGLLVLAVCLIVMGIFNGGMKDVLDKAVAICTECIGLG